MEIRRLLLMVVLLICMSLAGMPSLAQDSEPLTMLVNTGFDNFYRPGDWLPLQIQVRNEGAGLTGRLTVRPETSGRAVNTAYSVPIDLPSGSDKTVFLYVQAQLSARSLVVELIDGEGVRAAEQAVGITSIHPQDSLHMVISGTGANSIPLNNIAQAGFASRQGRWEVDNLPPDMIAFDAIDTLFLYDVESDAFTVEQLESIEAWVVTGGHLIIVGGPDWAQTTSALRDEFVPFIASGSENIDDISALASYINRADSLEARTFITTGEVAEGARVLAETEEGLPLYIRREAGLGAVDFLTVDPTLEPMRSWENIQEFWFTVVSNLPPEPGWNRGLLELQDAARALAILPGVELLPPASSMMLFIAAYVLMIGPVNYIVLSRIRRRAWAWVTIPLMIVGFTLLAWNAGFNLRGNEITLSRIYVVQSFPGTDIAYQEELVGVLSPRREIYTITAPENTVLGILPGVESDTFFSANVAQTTANISQGQAFSVENIAIDGGIFANFNINGITTAPDISGTATITYLPDERPDDAELNEPTPQSIRGIVRNESDIRLENVVIIARNRFYRLEADFEPGDLIDFDTADFQYINSSLESLFPIASPIQSSTEYNLEDIFSNRRSVNNSLVTSRVLLNLDWTSNFGSRDEDDLLEFNDEEMARRRAFLRAFLRDQHSTGGAGNQVYLFGWTSEQQPDDIMINDVSYRAVDTVLHIIELETEVELPPSSEIITLSADQYTWTTTDVTQGQVTGNFNDLTIINPGQAEFRVMPLEGAVLTDVSSMIVEVNRGTSLGRQIEISLWNFETSTWDTLENPRIEEYFIDNPAPYLGEGNAVNMQVAIDTDVTVGSSNGRLLQIRVIQRGNF